MTSAARSLQVFGIYVLITGATLVVLPNLFLSIFGLPGTEEVWIRVLGLVALVIGYYYLYAARKNITVFYPATVHGRLFAFLVFIALVVLNIGPPQLLLFGVLDLLAALWTWRAIRIA